MYISLRKITGLIFIIAFVMKFPCPLGAAYSVVDKKNNTGKGSEQEAIEMKQALYLPAAFNGGPQPINGDEVIEILNELSIYEHSNKFFLHKMVRSPQTVGKSELETVEKLSADTMSLPAVFGQICEFIKQKKADTPECIALIRVYQAVILQQALKDPCKKGDVNQIRLFMKAGADVKKIDERGNNALHIAAKERNLTVVQFLTPLFAKHGLLEKPGFDGLTPLHCAAANGDVECIKVLVYAGANFKIFDKKGNNILHITARAGNAALLKFLIPLFSKNGLLETPGFKGRTPLLYAAFSGDVECIKELLAAGAKLAVADEEGDNVLHFAAGYRKAAALHFLIPLCVKDGLLEKPGFHGLTPLHKAAFSGDVECLKLLLDAGACLTATDAYGDRALQLAALNGKAAAVMFLIPLFAKNGLLDKPDVYERTALLFAAYSGNVECIKALLDAGAQLETRDKKGFSALHIAAANGKAAAVEFLIPLFAKNGLLDNPDFKKQTSLLSAAIGGDVDCMRALLDAGAHLGARDQNDMNALHLASLHGRRAAVQFLAPLFAQVNLLDAPSKNAKAALQCAQAHNHYKVALLLWMLGAKLGDTWPMREEDESAVLQSALENVQILSSDEFEGLVNALGALHESKIIVPGSFTAVITPDQARFLPLRKAITDRIGNIRKTIREGLQLSLPPELEKIVGEYLFKNVPQSLPLNSGSSGLCLLQ